MVEVSVVWEEEEEGRRRELPVLAELWKVVKVTLLVSGLTSSSWLSRDTVSRLVRTGRW